jgi:hypothetical protein
MNSKFHECDPCSRIAIQDLGARPESGSRLSKRIYTPHYSLFLSLPTSHWKQKIRKIVHVTGGFLKMLLGSHSDFEDASRLFYGFLKMLLGSQTAF